MLATTTRMLLSRSAIKSSLKASKHLALATRCMSSGGGDAPVSDWNLSPRSEIDPKVARSQLRDNLYEALADEKANDKTASPEFNNLQSRILSRMQLSQTPGDMKVSLTQNYNNVETITVDFDCGDVDDDDDDDEFDEGNQEEEDVMDEEDDDDDEMTSLPFTVTVKKQASGDALVFECLAGESLIIDSVTYKDAAAAISSNNDDTSYEGPLFEDLDEETQVGFTEYLRERHVDTELAKFISEYSDVKDQHEFTKFLSKAADFV